MTTNLSDLKMSEATAKLMLHFVEDAGNWSGNPMVDVSKEQRGNLSDLKRKGLVTTFRSDGIDWVQFTKKAAEYYPMLNDRGYCLAD